MQASRPRRGMAPLPRQLISQTTSLLTSLESHVLDTAFAGSLAQRLDVPSQALLESQSGPLPTSPEVRLEPALFRVLLLRRLRLQLHLVLPCARVGAAWMLLATTLLLAHARVCCAHELSRSSELPLVSAERPGPLSPPTCYCATSTSLSNGRTSGA